MKGLIKRLMQRAGWELRRTAPPAGRSTMGAGLNWLAAQQFRFATVLDVGASDGRWLTECLARFPEARYLLFEPQPAHSRALDDFAARHAPRVQLIKQAVGASTGQTFFDASDPFGGALADRETAQTIQVSLTTLDAALSETRASPPYLLKLDTHGFERSILAGAGRTLEQCDALIIEAYAYRITDEAFLFWELCAFLAEKGFRVVDLVDVLHRSYDQSLWQVDLFFVRSTWPGFGYTSYS